MLSLIGKRGAIIYRRCFLMLNALSKKRGEKYRKMRERKKGKRKKEGKKIKEKK